MTTTIQQRSNNMNYYDYNRSNIINKNYKNTHCFIMCETLFEVDTKYSPIMGVGKGSYGIVCSFVNIYTNEKVAIKKISNVFGEGENVDDVGALRALREMKILGHIRHENIIALKDIMVDSSRSTFKDVYLVYELMDTDLHQIIKSNQSLTHDHIKYFMFQLLRGLNYLHSANILHRDLKPRNLLINANCALKICDFGLARTNKCPGQPMTEYVVTRWYRAPELLLNCDRYGPSIDVWAVGCIFAEMMDGKPIFPGKDPLDQLRQIIKVVGSPQDSDLAFVQSKKVYKFIKSFDYSSGQKRLSLFPGADPLAVDLLWKMLEFDPTKRITVAEALKHPYLLDLYDPELLRPAPIPCDLNMDGNIGSDKIRTFMWNEMMLYHPAPGFPFQPF